MCELFGVCSQNIIQANSLLEDFFSHSEKNPDGWGLVVFRRGAVTLEKEPLKATRSRYLKHRLSESVEGENIFAHIRAATIGNMDYSNCHPFVWDDAGGRTWTLVHNGTLFEPDAVTRFSKLQKGTTDSEELLLYLVDQINQRILADGTEPNAEERFQIVDKMMVELSRNNKLNLLIYDGELMYVHTNYRASLYEWNQNGTSVFATKPLREGAWVPLPMNQLLAYRAGKRLRCGTPHDNEFLDEEHDINMVYATYSEL